MICVRCGRKLKETKIEGVYRCIYCHVGIYDLIYRTTTPQPTIEFVDMLNKEIDELKMSSLEKENAQLKEEIDKWRNGEYVSNKVAEKSFEMRDKLENQKAVECLKKLKEDLKFNTGIIEDGDVDQYLPKIDIFLDTKIKELEEQK